MLISFIRTVILYSLIVIAMRFMGKRQIGQLEPMELVVALMISDVASIPMSDISIPLVQGAIPILTLLFVEIVSSALCLKFRKIRRFIYGTPVIIIKNGKIIESEMKRLRLTLDDLSEELRNNGCYEIQNIAYAIFETDGKISVLPKKISQPITNADVNRNPSDKSTPFLFVSDGVINDKALADYQKDAGWLRKQLKKNGDLKIEDLLYMSADGNGEVYFQKKKGRAE